MTLRSEGTEAVKHSVVLNRNLCRKPKSLKMKLDLFRKLVIWFVACSSS